MTKSFPFADGVAVITGAGSGIGRALSLALAERRCHLALADRNPQTLHETALRARQHGVTVSEHELDVADATALAALPDAVVAAHGRATLLVNNAGVALAGTFEQTDLADFAWLFDINFWGPVRLTKAFLPVLRQAPAAHIVNISSLFGLIAPAGQTAYAASKFAVRGFSEALRHELDGSNIGVSVVHPGGVRTQIAASARVPDAVVATIDPAQRARMDKFLVMPPEDAAAIILGGVATRAPRILVGADAKRGDLLQRLRPGKYWETMRKRMQREIAKTKAEAARTGR